MFRSQAPEQIKQFDMGYSFDGGKYAMPYLIVEVVSCCW